MKKNFMFLLVATIISVVSVSCKSDSDKLKDMTDEMNELTERMKSVDSAAEFSKVVDDYNDLISNVPSSIKDMSSADLSNLDAYTEFEKAQSKFTIAYSAAAAKGYMGTVGDILGGVSDAMDAVDDMKDAVSDILGDDDL